MDSVNNNNKIAKLFITMGFIGLLISIIDVLDLMFPLNISNPAWIFTITQNFINSLLAPALCITLTIIGICFIENYFAKKNILIFEQIISILSFAFGLLICLNLLFYSLSIKSYETSTVSSIKTQSETVLKRLDQIYGVQKANISVNLYNQKITEIKNETNKQIKYAKKMLLRKNIKLIPELILYSLLFFIISITSFNSSKNNLLKLKFSK